MNKRPVSYMQTDKRWKDKPYRVPGETSTIGGSGCGPTSAAMLIETLTGQTYTPEDACAWALEHGYKALHQGTYYGYFVAQFKAFGIECRRLNTSNVYGKPTAPIHNEALKLLGEGWYLIACMGKGNWTKSGHYIVVWGREVDKLLINDPASKKPERVRGDLDLFRSQVKYYWAIDAREHNKEDIDLTKDEIRAIVREELKAWLSEQDAREPDQRWQRDCLERAVAAGITDGSRPMGICRRVEAMAMASAKK